MYRACSFCYNSSLVYQVCTKMSNSKRLLFETLEPREVPAGLIGPFTVHESYTVITPPLVAVGSGLGGGEVRVFDPYSGEQTLELFPFGRDFTGGVNVGFGGLSPDGTREIVASVASGGGPRVVVLDGSTGVQLRSFFAYESTFTGGVNIAVREDNYEIITGAGPGGGPHVKVFDGQTFAELSSFYAYDPHFAGGVSVAELPVFGSFEEIVTGAGPGGGSNIRIFNTSNGELLMSFNAFESSFAGGVSVAAAFLPGSRSGYEIIVGAGAGGGPRVCAFDRNTGLEIMSIFAFDGTFTGGVQVASNGLVPGTYGEIIVGSGQGGEIRCSA